jgi:hypothetical protein
MSVRAGLAFAPYAGFGASTDDGLAPGDTYAALHTACMNDAGCGQYADTVPLAFRTNRGLAFAQPFGLRSSTRSPCCRARARRPQPVAAAR